MKIVVVEDEIRTRRGVVSLLTKLNPNYEIAGEAENGRMGLELIRELNPDLAIVDVKMPEMDGIQMIEEMRKQGVKCRTVILSGYSDFEYAQKAIKLGISEYLLKPITVEDFENMLKNIEGEIETERKLEEKQDSIASVEHLLQNLILGDLRDEEQCLEYLNERFHMPQDSTYSVAVIYLGDEFENSFSRVKQTILPLLKVLEGNKYYVLDLNAHNELLILVQSPETPGELEKYFQNVVLKTLHEAQYKNVIMGWIEIDHLQKLKSSLQILKKELKWSIVLGEDILISYPKTQNIHTRPVQYPVDAEKNVKAAIYSNDLEKFSRNVEEFLALWRRDLYRPEQMIDVFVRFTSSMIHVIKEVNPDLYGRINQKETLWEIMNALSWHEIKSPLLEIAEKVTAYTKGNEKIYSLVIIKAINFMQENFANPVSLEEVASKLGITPEYLSSLFFRETGENFSTYIKNYRINKAKELLMNTNLKTYEIGSKVGYSDPKYFSRVFKEVTGFSPGEYQKAYKV